MPGNIQRLALAVAASAAVLAPGLAQAGGLGVADSVGQISDEMVGVGAIATVFVPIIFGIAWAMGMNGVLAFVMSLAAAGVFIGNADAIAGVLFNGGAGGGGSIFDVAVLATSVVPI